MARIAIITAAGIAAFIGYRFMSRPDLKYFKPSEFGVWWPLINADLLRKADDFRDRWGAAVMISPAEGGIGREDDSGSQHNVLKWGEVRALDLMPKSMDTAYDRRRAVNIAMAVGFTGIGIYPDWKPRPGIHVDVREPKEPGHIAMWSGVRENGNQVYANIERGLA